MPKPPLKSELPEPPEPLSVFISYAHADAPFKDQLLTHLAILRRKNLLKSWTDRQIDGGGDWRFEIDQAMDGCHLALLLISPAFLASDFIQTEEMLRLLARREGEGIRVVPIILRPCMWHFDRASELQALPRDGKPIVTFSEGNGDRDQAWVEVGNQIAGWAIDFLAQQTRLGQPGPSDPPAASPPPRALASGARDAASLVNPFNPWQVALPPRFFGRDEVLRGLAAALDQNRSVSLVGDWRIGKSSLLAAWKIKTEGLGRVVRLLSGEGPEAVSCALFVAAVTEGEIAKDEPEMAEMADKAADKAANALDAWAGAIAKNGLPPLLLIDEADAMLPRLPHRFFERLRGMVAQQRLCLVLATRREVDTIYQANGGTSPFNNLLEMRRIGLLERDGAESLIALGGMAFDDRLRALMRRWAGWHPYYLALLGWHLWEAVSSGTEIDDALDGFNDEAAGRLRELWKTLRVDEQAALCGVLDGADVGQLRAKMKRRGLVVQDGDGLQLFGEVLTAWLTNRG